jgi:hypothetical protein
VEVVGLDQVPSLLSLLWLTIVAPTVCAYSVTLRLRLCQLIPSHSLEGYRSQAPPIRFKYGVSICSNICWFVGDSRKSLLARVETSDAQEEGDEICWCVNHCE